MECVGGLVVPIKCESKAWKGAGAQGGKNKQPGSIRCQRKKDWTRWGGGATSGTTPDIIFKISAGRALSLGHTVTTGTVKEGIDHPGRQRKGTG